MAVKTTQAILLDAVDLLKARGWHQASLGNSKRGPLCAIAALRVSAFNSIQYPYSEGHDPDLIDEYRTALTRILEHVGAVAPQALDADKDYQVALWNDSETVDQDVVIAMFRVVSTL